jgi:hypothetical protein
MIVSNVIFDEGTNGKKHFVFFYLDTKGRIYQWRGQSTKNLRTKFILVRENHQESASCKYTYM